MLDLDHPQSEHVFQAAKLEDEIVTYIKRMTLLPTQRRVDLLKKIENVCREMKILNRDHFGASAYIQDAVDELLAGCESIAHGESDKDLTDGTGQCDVCGTKITSLDEYEDMIYCGNCLDTTSRARDKLEGSEGFGTWAI